jgi:hypothetical protein
MITTSNHSIQRMGASRSAHFQFLRQRRLSPTADADRWAADRIKHV